MFGQAPRDEQNSIATEIAGLMSAVAGQPMARGFGDALHFGAINGHQRPIARFARLHFHENDQLPAPRDNINLAALGCVRQIENAPATQTQPHTREKFSLDPEASGAATILSGARRAQPSPPSASADN